MTISCAGYPFMNFTMYFIDDNRQLKTFCPDTVPVPGNHTGQNLAKAVQANLICATMDHTLC